MATEAYDEVEHVSREELVGYVRVRDEQIAAARQRVRAYADLIISIHSWCADIGESTLTAGQIEGQIRGMCEEVVRNPTDARLEDLWGVMDRAHRSKAQESAIAAAHELVMEGRTPHLRPKDRNMDSDESGRIDG